MIMFVLVFKRKTVEVKTFLIKRLLLILLFGILRTMSKHDSDIWNQKNIQSILFAKASQYIFFICFLVHMFRIANN